MENNKRFISLKTKIMLSTLIPIIISYSLISSIIFIELFNSLHEAAKAELLQITQKYAANFESTINNAMNYLSISASTIELRNNSESPDRELMQKTALYIFDNYGLVDGSSIYFEPNKYDGRDADYIGSDYGTAASGSICYYFYKNDGKTAYLPEALENDIEFELPHYTKAKKANKPVYTEPAVYEVDGREIPMFTLTYPIQDADGGFIGAVTVDLFLEDLYEQLQNEKIYDTGYVIIENDNGQVIYSPIYEDIGKTREEAGLDYTLPSENETSVFINANSVLNGHDSLLAIGAIYIPQLDSRFYISVVAPTREINADGTQLVAALVIFNMLIIIAIGLLIYYLIGKISAPIKEITESANKIANGDIDKSSAFALSDHNTITMDEVNILSVAIKKMLSQLNEMQALKFESLELKHKKEKAEAAAMAKNDFLARMSHEIRTPMNSVMGMTELILRKNLPPDVYEDALMIKNASVNLLSIINDILDFSKIESGMLEIIETEYLLPSLFNDVISIIRVRLIDKPIHFIVNIDPSVPSALIGDETRIRQTLINLLSNAVKYTNEGYISMAVTGQIRGNTVTLAIEISDSGIGVNEDDIDKLFGDFVQIDTAKNKGIEGTGLGLAISRRLCRAMGGDITLRSEYGKGSTFSIILPQKFESYEPFASIDDPSGKSVLLYETRQIYRDSLIRTLESLGVAYKSAENIPMLFDNLEYYSYVFVSSFVYGSINPVLSKMDNPPMLVLLSDITETIAPRDARILILPSHALTMANILNDIYEDYSGTPVIGASFIAPDAKILIVDDVTANLKVGEGLLLPYEVQVTLCMSGREALELVAANRYDLVFMDHMMPEMDGLEAVGHIRAMDGEYYRSLPIIALTANAVSGVKEMFIQNGMNDFLAKPIETAKLDAILDKWLPKDKKKKIKITEKPAARSDFVDMLKSVPQLSVDKALSVVGGSVDTYERIIRLTVRLLPENIARLDALIETDLPNYAIEVHGLKGVLNNIGAYAFGDTAYELEKASKNGDMDVCKALHPPFMEALKNFGHIMMDLMNEMDVPDKTPGDRALLREALLELEGAADFFDSVRALEIISSIDKYTYGEVADKTVTELARAFEGFDFDRVIVLLEHLKSEINTNE